MLENLCASADLVVLKLNSKTWHDNTFLYRYIELTDRKRQEKRVENIS